MDQDEPQFDGFAMDAHWIEELLPQQLRAQARELIEGVTPASMWIRNSIGRPDGDEIERQAVLLLGVANMITEGTMRIAQIETARSGSIGISPEILQHVQRGMFGALLLSGIRFGQNHAEAFLEYQVDDAAGQIQTLLEQLLEEFKKGGEAGPDDESDQP